MQGSHPVIGGVGAPSKPDRVSLLEPGHPCSPRGNGTVPLSAGHLGTLHCHLNFSVIYLDLYLYISSLFNMTTDVRSTEM